jgi:uncharacterized protein
MSLMEVVHAKRAEIQRLAAQHGAGNVRVFGSVLHGQETSHSDVDFLIDVVGRTTAWFPSGLIRSGTAHFVTCHQAPS